MRAKIVTSNRRAVSISLLLLMALLTALDSMAIDMYLPGMPDIAEDLQVPFGRVQQTLAIFLGGLAIGQGIYGPLLDRFGRRIPLLIGIIIFIIGSIMGAVAPTVEWLLAARFIQAIGASAGLVTPRAIVADTCNLKESAHVFSLLMQAMMLGPILAPVLGGIVLDISDWRMIFWVIAFVGLISLVWAWYLVPDSLPIQDRSPLNVKYVCKTYFAQMGNFHFMLYALASGFAMSGLFLYVSSSAYIFREHFGLSSTMFSYLFAMNSIGLVVSGMISNIFLVRGVSARALLMIGMIIHTLFAAILYLLTQQMSLSILVYTALLAISISALGLVLGNITALTMNSGGKQAGAASSVMGVLQYLLPAITGYIATLFVQSIALLPIAIAICGILAIGLLMLCRVPQNA
ncbi:multidrug effflux MFS transporter [Ignatzschineria rhizosphaerae]|uniref:Bcr/CflA family efflux transporter n=1 Tax=Ignatzschineria rhizosphaerae TaxID=2923279 RepID=A0ABY3X138_9GAMM|nr:multidrug effflux MFS transporter [Ignatzschineria rhizosphaerae]UNM95404.1 multidrug effflux MFS transporter [Ignatzschineria rhizosphaerae]